LSISHYENLPGNWNIVSLGEVCNLNNGEKRTGQYIYFDAKCLRGNRNGSKISSGNFVPRDDYVILVDGENSGEVFVIPEDGYMGSTFKRIMISKEMYLPYVLYFIKNYQKTLRDSKKGAAIPHLNKGLFKNLEMWVPPYAEQQRIVPKIEAMFTTLDLISQNLAD
jgi:type I restriction enzyme S subunit